MSKINVVKVTGELKKPTILINFVLDESGSMASQQQQVITGFNEYIQDLKKKNDADYMVTLVSFSSESEVAFANRAISLVEEIDKSDYSPSGWTALRDAIGQTILTSDAALTLYPEAKVLTFIFTDGWENASKNFTAQQLQKMIAKREKNSNWTFTFIGASADCLKQATDYGINWGNVIQYNSSNMNGTIAAMSAATSTYTSGAARGSGNTTTFFKDAGLTSSADIDNLGAQVEQTRSVGIVTPTTTAQPGNMTQKK